MSELIDFLRSKEVNQFILENATAGIQSLILNPPKQFKDRIKPIADQILARQKAKGKLDSWLVRDGLLFPPPLSIEQASSDQTATYKKRFFEGDHLVDLTGGMGVDCLALSENFKHTTYVEQNPRLCEIFEHNLPVFCKSIQIINREAETFLKDLDPQQTTSFFIDPARRDEAKNKVFQLEDCSPNLLQILPDLKQRGKQLLIKLSPILDLKSILAEIPNVKELHVISIKNEVKEILVLVDFEFIDEPTVKTINLGAKEETLDFSFSEEREAEAKIGSLKQYLYEPNAAILKAGAFKLIGTKFGLHKIHLNTHLYTSDTLIENWPGRVFEVVEQQVDKKILKHYAPEGLINVMTRNYPMDPKALKGKFKLKDGGDYFLIGFRNQKDKPTLVISRKIL